MSFTRRCRNGAGSAGLFAGENARPTTRRQGCRRSQPMISNHHSPLLVRPRATHGEYLRVTPETAGWEHLHFAARRLKRGEQWPASAGDFEYGLVIQIGRASCRERGEIWVGEVACI